jgi:hypothetical protein
MSIGTIVVGTCFLPVPIVVLLINIKGLQVARYVRIKGFIPSGILWGLGPKYDIYLPNSAGFIIAGAAWLGIFICLILLTAMLDSLTKFS